MTENFKNVKDSVGLVSIRDLIDSGVKFYIPSYQRGYRWTKLEVEALLDDIYEYNKDYDGEFYCLQPLVVKNGTCKVNSNYEDRWRVIDGQQRLTTIYLFLKYIESLNTPDIKNFDIRYERGTNIDKCTESVIQDEKSIELYYLKSNFKIIKDWQPNTRCDIISKILDQTKFIWYNIKVDTNANEYTIFRNLNSGKIPLTNAELVKALFLKNIKTKEQDFQVMEQSMKKDKEQDDEHTGIQAKELQQSLIAEQFDQMERKLREPEFWYFIAGRNPRKTSCIAIIFDLMLATDKDLSIDEKQDIERVGRNKTFYYFERYISYDKSHKRLNNQEQFKKAKEVWKKVQECFHTIEGWFADAETYNLIGFLRSCGYPLHTIYELYNKCTTKRDFIKNLKIESIKRCGINVENSLNYDFDYKKNSCKVSGINCDCNSCSDHDCSLKNWLSKNKYQDTFTTPILLMSNIATLNLQNAQTDKDKQSDTAYDTKQRKDKINEKVKFSFASYHLCAWNVEHISPYNAYWSEDLGRTEFIKCNSLSECLKKYNEKQKYLKTAKDEIEKLYNGDTLWKELDKYVAVEENSLMELPNLTLLTQSDNIKVSNHTFREKREQVMGFAKNGSFIPPCSLMVFTKGYLSDLKRDKLDFWSDEDRNAYLNEICRVFNQYFQGVLINNE